MALVPVVHKKEDSSLNSKYLYKKEGFNMAVNKVTATEKKSQKPSDKRVREEEASGDDEEESDSEEEEEEEDNTTVNQLIVPANFAAVDELRARLKAKVDSARNFSEPGDGKRQKRKEMEAKKKKQQKEKKQKQKARHGDKEKKEALEKENAEDPVDFFAKKAAKKDGQEPPAKKAKKEKEEATPEVSTDKKNVITIDPSKIGADFMFGTVARPVFSKELSRLEQLTNKKAGKRNDTKEVTLKKVENFKARVQKVKESGDTHTAEKMIHDSTVKAALARATGENVKDDEKKLKKSIKRDQKKKEKSTVEWAARKKAVEKSQKERATKRTENINKKADLKRDKRLGKKKSSK